MKLTYYGKRGSLVDPIFSGAFILKVVIVIFIAIFIWYQFQDIMTVAISGSSSEATILNAMSNLRSAYQSFDYVFPILVVGIMIMSIIFAYKTGANIMWGFLSLIAWAIALLMSSVYVNVFAELATAFPTIYNDLGIISLIAQYLDWITFFWVGIILLVMFRKNNQEDTSSTINKAETLYYS